MKRILLAIITYEGQKYCREYFMRFLNALTYPDVDFLFVTNSGDEDKKDLESVARILKKQFTVLVNDKKYEHKYDYLVSNRNIAREYFLDGKWDSMLFLDSDMIGPSNLVEAMLNPKKDLMTGVYFGVFERDGKPHTLPVLYGFDKPGHARQLAIIDVLEPRLLPLACAGLGCCLIKRHILEQISFRRYENSTEDAAFFLDCRNMLDETLWCDTRIKCWHHKFPPGDKRNNIYDPRRYVLEKKTPET